MDETIVNITIMIGGTIGIIGGMCAFVIFILERI